MDDDDDFGSGIDDAEFLAIATQAEQQFTSSTNRTAQSTHDQLLANRFDHDANEYQNGPPSFSQVPVAARGGSFRQTTLFGSAAVDTGTSLSQPARRNWPLANTEEKPTHHRIDLEAAKTWVYPVNVSYRDYQFNIVRRALLSNVLCALPTGLGKTFIAATVMLNWFRWAPEGQIAFLAPTKPLVHQQIEACFHIAGIPRSQTATMTGGVAKALRQEYWEGRRVFFTTPQTMHNDIKNGLCDPKRIVCLVVDEAHRTTGAYAYGEVVKLVRRENGNFRLLALTATPGSTVEAVQGVIDALGISKIEIRTDQSLDIRKYIQRRNLEVQTFPASDEMVELRDLYCNCLEPMLKKLNAAKAFYQTNVENLTAFGVVSAMKEWMNSQQARNLDRDYYWSLRKIFKNLASLAHPMTLLNTHGIRLFYDKLLNARDDDVEGEVDKSAVNSIRKERSFADLMARAAEIVAEPNFSGHPKVDFMVNSILKHFSEAEDEDTKRSTRIMVFTSFRDSAEEVARLLRRHEPMIRPHVFVGQTNSRNSAGMSQKQQLEIIEKFSNGTYNTIVSTSIGEEGLDIGEVDLIVCYDTSSSPIRLLQRMGRTGRKRVGSVLILLSEGREHESYKRALDNYAIMQKKIAAGSDFSFPHELSPRIIPKEINPQPDKRHIDIPIENTQPEPDKRKARVKKKAPPKKFFMPEGVKAGFTKASRIGKDNALSTDSSASGSGNELDEGAAEEPLAPILDTSAGLLTGEEQVLLEKHFMQDFGTFGTDPLVVEPPRLDKFPKTQRTLTATNHVQHGAVTKRFVKMVKRMRQVDDERLEQLQANFDADLLKNPKKKTTAFKPVRPATAAPKPSVTRRKTPSLQEKTRNVENANELEVNHRKSEKPAKPVKPAKSTKPPAQTKGMLGKRTIHISSDDREDDDVRKKPGHTISKTKRRKVVPGDSDSIIDGVSDSDDLPDAKELLSSFRWAGARRRTR